jgi:hypothetical protein
MRSPSLRIYSTNLLCHAERDGHLYTFRLRSTVFRTPYRLLPVSRMLAIVSKAASQVNTQPNHAKPTR